MMWRRKFEEEHRLEALRSLAHTSIPRQIALVRALPLSPLEIRGPRRMVHARDLASGSAPGRWNFAVPAGGVANLVFERVHGACHFFAGVCLGGADYMLASSLSLSCKSSRHFTNVLLLQPHFTMVELFLQGDLPEDDRPLFSFDEGVLGSHNSMLAVVSLQRTDNFAVQAGVNRIPLRLANPVTSLLVSLPHDVQRVDLVLGKVFSVSQQFSGELDLSFPVRAEGLAASKPALSHPGCARGRNHFKVHLGSDGINMNCIREPHLLFTSAHAGVGFSSAKVLNIIREVQGLCGMQYGTFG